ncbi:MAG: DNA-binding transcriptional regulator Fis [Gammaproteobacteria bacterium]|nr:DNA-binding transcriptional regulator Fis [Gammaproteobacteria bacterium]
MNTIKNNVIPMSITKNIPESNSLSETVRRSLAQFLDEMEGDQPENLYDMVLQQIEEPMLELVMQYVDGNQSRAADCLGLNRGTLRKKLKAYNLLK